MSKSVDQKIDRINERAAESIWAYVRYYKDSLSSETRIKDITEALDNATAEARKVAKEAVEAAKRAKAESKAKDTVIAELTEKITESAAGLRKELKELREWIANLATQREPV